MPGGWRDLSRSELASARLPADVEVVYALPEDWLDAVARTDKWREHYMGRCVVVYDRDAAFGKVVNLVSGSVLDYV